MINRVEMANIRSKIDQVDNKLLGLIAERAELALEMKKVKGTDVVYSPSREVEILRRVQQENPSKLPSDSIKAIFSEIIGANRNLESILKVAYLGPEGTYSHEAAEAMLGSSSDFVPQLTLPEVLRAAETGSVDVAFLPIENSSEGAVIQTHRLLQSTPLQISGEYTLPVQHCLLSNSSILKEIKSVHAHPQALGQCREWLQVNLPTARLISEGSNSQAAMIAAKKPNSAAIASQKASDFAKVPVLIRGINDFAGNQTRFITLSNYIPMPTGDDKTSIICTVGDKVGALYDLLGIFSKHNISLTRLESQPQPDHIYAFYIDFDGHSANDVVSAAMNELVIEAKTCKILGSYPKG